MGFRVYGLRFTVCGAHIVFLDVVRGAQGGLGCCRDIDVFIRGNLFFFSLTSEKILHNCFNTTSKNELCSKFRGCRTQEK